MMTAPWLLSAFLWLPPPLESAVITGNGRVSDVPVLPVITTPLSPVSLSPLPGPIFNATPLAPLAQAGKTAEAAVLPLQVSLTLPAAHMGAPGAERPLAPDQSSPPPKEEHSAEAEAAQSGWKFDGAANRVQGPADAPEQGRALVPYFADEVRLGLFSPQEATHLAALQTRRSHLASLQSEFETLFDSPLYPVLLAKTLEAEVGRRKASAQALEFYGLLNPEFQHRVAAGLVSRLKALVFLEPDRIADLRRTLEKARMKKEDFEFFSGVMRPALADEGRVIDAVTAHIASASSSPSFVDRVAEKVPRFKLFGLSSPSIVPSKKGVSPEMKAIFNSKLTLEAQLSAIAAELDRREHINAAELVYLLKQMPRGVGWGWTMEKNHNDKAEIFYGRMKELGLDVDWNENPHFFSMDVYLAAQAIRITLAAPTDESLLSQVPTLVDRVLNKSKELTNKDKTLQYRTYIRRFLFEELRRMPRGDPK